ncbi:hypothetical protein [Levilactobacillus suantsaii]|uniref:hypothetical protein n=1 Tax=Levilactobacillus suantsaii TaxID=2292255 RepID=UPI001F2DA3DE|nr:hypothetical protein [Levilactobacillus suantsaii]
MVKTYKIKKNGKFTIKLTKKQAKKLLRKHAKSFKVTVAQKGYRTYSFTVKIAK